MEDRLKYDLLRKIDKLKMSVLLIVGDLDYSHFNDQKILLHAIKTDKKELKIISGAPHTFKDEMHLQEFSKVLSEWVKKLN